MYGSLFYFTHVIVDISSEKKGCPGLMITKALPFSFLCCGDLPPWELRSPVKRCPGTQERQVHAAGPFPSLPLTGGQSEASGSQVKQELLY